MDIFVSDLVAGMILSEDVFTENGELVLGTGVKLNSQFIDKLNDKNIFVVHVHESKDNDVSNAKPLVIEKSDTQLAYERSVERFKGVFNSIRFGRHVGMGEISDIVEPLVDQVMNNKGVVRQLWQLESCDLYTFDHSVSVSLTSALLARWLKCDNETIRLVAIAGLMHDIGKVNIPDEILNKPGSLTPEEMKVMKTHATLGYVLLMNQKSVPDEVLLAVLQHHERYDGCGYPSGLKGENIHPVSRIVSVADIFCAMTTKRVYREASNPFYVAKQIQEQSYGYLDPKLTHVFLARISNYYIGNLVKISDGRIGEVVMIHRTAPHRPLIRVDDVFVDLLREGDLDIEAVIY